MEAASVWPALKDVEKRREAAEARADAQEQEEELAAPEHGDGEVNGQSGESDDGI